MFRLFLDHWFYTKITIIDICCKISKTFCFSVDSELQLLSSYNIVLLFENCLELIGWKRFKMRSDAGCQVSMRNEQDQGSKMTLSRLFYGQPPPVHDEAPYRSRTKSAVAQTTRPHRGYALHQKFGSTPVKRIFLNSSHPIPIPSRRPCSFPAIPGSFTSGSPESLEQELR